MIKKERKRMKVKEYDDLFKYDYFLKSRNLKERDDNSIGVKTVKRKKERKKKQKKFYSRYDNPGLGMVLKL